MINSEIFDLASKKVSKILLTVGLTLVGAATLVGCAQPTATPPASSNVVSEVSEVSNVAEVATSAEQTDSGLVEPPAVESQAVEPPASTSTSLVDDYPGAAADNGWDGVSDLSARYQLAGEWLSADRSGELSWKDGSNWRDGESHMMPDVPLPEGGRVVEHMTCSQWEVLDMASFPQGESLLDWHTSANADSIDKQWQTNLATNLWGTEPTDATKWLWMRREDYVRDCGMGMGLNP